MSATHGLASTYRSQFYACRCEECRRANTKRHRESSARRAAKLAADPTLAPHGKASTYRNWGCRCPACTEVHKADCRNTRARRRARTGT